MRKGQRKWTDSIIRRRFYSPCFSCLFARVWFILVALVVVLSQSKQGIQVVLVFEGIMTRHLMRKIQSKTMQLLKGERKHIFMPTNKKLTS